MRIAGLYFQAPSEIYLGTCLVSTWKYTCCRDRLARLREPSLRLADLRYEKSMYPHVQWIGDAPTVHLARQNRW